MTSIVFSPNTQQTEFTVTATSWVKTPFLSVLNLFNSKGRPSDAPAGCKGNYYACAKVISKATAQICLNCSDIGGGNADDGTNLEISMMLDVTGSMAGDKIVDLQVAAKDLIDIVVWDDQSKYTSKVALAPFAPAVNVGPTTSPRSRASPTRRTTTASARTSTIRRPASRANGNVEEQLQEATADYNESKYIAKYAKCVVERTGTEPVHRCGTAPTTHIPADLERCAGQHVNDCDTRRQDRAAHHGPHAAEGHHRRLQGQRHDGRPAGHGLRLVPAVAQLEQCVAGGERSRRPTARRRCKKIAILMTDGEYNTLQGKQYSDGSAQATTALNNAKALCTGMKKKLLPSDPNIEIYTVGFKLDHQGLQDDAEELRHRATTTTTRRRPATA